MFSLTRIVGRGNLAMCYLQNEINFYVERGARLLDWWLMTGADLFWEKSIASWLLLAGLFWEKKYCWLVADKSNEQGVPVKRISILGWPPSQFMVVITHYCLWSCEDDSRAKLDFEHTLERETSDNIISSDIRELSKYAWYLITVLAWLVNDASVIITRIVRWWQVADAGTAAQAGGAYYCTTRACMPVA
jgi:hypothetical protein